MRPSAITSLVVVAMATMACSGAPAGSTAAPTSAAPSAPTSATPSAVEAPPPSPTPSPTEAQLSLPASWTGATSKRLHYSIDYPTDWVVTAATQDWPAIHFPFPLGPAVDRYATSAENETVVVVTSEPLAPGEDAAMRLAELDFVNAGEGSGNGCQLSDRHTVSLDGTVARQEDFFCFSDHGIEVAVTEAGRFYMVDMLAKHVLTPTDRAIFDRFVGSFRFD